jgi:hypothetical protein
VTLTGWSITLGSLARCRVVSVPWSSLGTTKLFAALKVATDRVTDARQPRHRHGEFVDSCQSWNAKPCAAATSPAIEELVAAV